MNVCQKYLPLNFLFPERCEGQVRCRGLNSWSCLVARQSRAKLSHRLLTPALRCLGNSWLTAITSLTGRTQTVQMVARISALHDIVAAVGSEGQWRLYFPHYLPLKPCCAKFLETYKYKCIICDFSPSRLCQLTDWGQITHICVNNLGHHWFR